MGGKKEKMAFHLTSASKKDNQLKRKYDEELTALITAVHQNYSTLLQLEQNAYDLPEELLIFEKIAEAKYLFLLREVKKRQMKADISAPKKAKAFKWRKRTNHAEDIFQSEE